MKPGVPGETDNTAETIEEIIEQVKAGDKQRYGAIIRKFERQMYTYCYYILRNHAETEDAVQEIFIRAYEQLHKYERQVSFSAWLYKMAYHHLINLKKKQSRWLKLVNHCKEQQTLPQVSPHAPVVEDMLAELKPDEQHLLLLKAVEQYTFEEIAGIMGIQAANARKKYQRLRHKLLNGRSQEGGIVNGTFAKSNGIR